MSGLEVRTEDLTVRFGEVPALDGKMLMLLAALLASLGVRITGAAGK